MTYRVIASQYAVGMTTVLPSPGIVTGFPSFGHETRPTGSGNTGQLIFTGAGSTGFGDVVQDVDRRSNALAVSTRANLFSTFFLLTMGLL